MTLRDALGPIFADEAFAERYPSLGQPAESPGRLALVAVLQFMEQLTDREAADAVRTRIDWKYVLGLELRDSGFHYSVLTEFRQRLIEHQATRLLLDRILERCQEKGLLKGAKKQRTDSTRMLARYGSKDGSTWTGYTVHLTETCEQDAPRLVTHIETTVATSRDATVTEKVPDDLIARGLEREMHLADGGYMDADNLVSRQEKEIVLVGPVQ